MDKFVDFLKNWAKEFVRNKNIMTKTVVSISDNPNSENEVIVKHKTKEQRIIAIPFLNSFYDALKELGASPELNLSIVTFNSDQSFKALIDNWKELTKYKNFNVYFVNPFSQTDKKWIISPHVHSRICDDESLELGLRSMFETVDKISESEAKTKV